MDYSEYEIEIEKNEKVNSKLLLEFKKLILNAGLTARTADKHIANMDFYLNDFLIRYEIVAAEDGWEYIDSFLGDFFIRKAMWSSESTTKENIASLKKFYSFLVDINLVEKNDYSKFLREIKSNKKHWINEVNKYNNFDENYYDEI